MSDLAPRTSEAVHELLDLMRGLDENWTRGERALDDETSVLEGYKWLFSITQVALDCFVWGDADNPRWVDIVGRYKKWGGDNTDAYYQYVPLDPRRTYRVWGTKGDAVYFSLTVYGGPDDGRWSERIVGTLNDRDLDVDPGGEFELFLGPEPTGDGHWIRLEDDAVCAITRDYVEEYETSRRVEWRIEALDRPATYRLSDEDLARRFRAAATWLKDQSSLTPLQPGEPNTVAEPYPVPSETFGWAAGDAAYAMGWFDLADDEVLVVRGSSPECAFWNLCLWNRFMHTYNFDYERVAINGTQVVYEDDGSWEIVIGASDPGHPNFVSTQGHPAGMLWFRWFHPDQTPARPTTEVVKAASFTT